MTSSIALYCKSYRLDFLRVKRLLISLQKHNREALSVYISTPAADHDLLVDVLDYEGLKQSYEWVADEDIIAANLRAPKDVQVGMAGGLSQAIVKAEFWRLGLVQNYLCIDSDSVFIRDFGVSDFLARDGNPYTVLHQNKELFQLATNLGHTKVERDLRAEAVRVQQLFGRLGPQYYCAPAPFIWSAKVWQSLDDQYLLPKGLTLWDAVTPEYPETLLYGEALLNFQAIPIRMIEPLFRIYHYDWQYYTARRLGETEAKLKQNFLGIIYQSNWESELDYGSSNKSFASSVLKSIKRYIRYVQSYF